MLTFFGDDEEEQKHHIIGNAKTSGLIRGMDDVESFTLQTNYIEPIQKHKFYVKTSLRFFQASTTFSLWCLLLKLKYEIIGSDLHGQRWNKLKSATE